MFYEGKRLDNECSMRLAWMLAVLMALMFVVGPVGAKATIEEDANTCAETIEATQIVAADLEAQIEEAPPERPKQLYAPDGSGALLSQEQTRIVWLVWDRALAEGFTRQQAAGLLGNIWQESKFDPHAHSKSGAYGLVQWMNGRKRNLWSWSNYWKAETQVDFLFYELKNGEWKADGKIRATTTVVAAASAVGRWYERCAHPNARGGYAQAFYDQMAQY